SLTLTRPSAPRLASCGVAGLADSTKPAPPGYCPFGCRRAFAQGVAVFFRATVARYASAQGESSLFSASSLGGCDSAGRCDGPAHIRRPAAVLDYPPGGIGPFRAEERTAHAAPEPSQHRPPPAAGGRPS